jgi:tRNA wybutosine-synthesizing protein 2
MLIPTTWYSDDDQEEDPVIPHPDVAVQIGKIDHVRIREENFPDTKENPIYFSVSTWLADLPAEICKNQEEWTSELLVKLPKRWSVYRPMLLLPSGSFESEDWADFLRLPEIHNLKTNLWGKILAAVSKKDGGQPLTHLAVNQGIPQCVEDVSKDQKVNTLRSPSGLRMLYGDFGPARGPSTSWLTHTVSDFEEAFWVSTKQNGIYQTWAPRYTMFSRGNIKEKARIASFHRSRKEVGTKISYETSRSQLCGRASAVDLYGGIGYFVFSYVQMGMDRVLCWEINPWSVEALRRGAVQNGWSVKVAKGDELMKPMHEIVAGKETIVVLEESNERAGDRMTELRNWEASQLMEGAEPLVGDIIHVNGGFLPSSETTWQMSLGLVSRNRDSWLHLHENVGVHDIGSRELDVTEKFVGWVGHQGQNRDVRVQTERVKSFAPGVEHCVFDVHLSPVVSSTKI